MLSSKSASLLGFCAQSRTQLLPFLAPSLSIRYASGTTKKKGELKAQKKKKASTHFKRKPVIPENTFALVDAMRYIRAFEVGYPPTSPKYDLAISFKTLKSGPVVRSRTRLPHVIDSSQRVAVICDPNSAVAEQAIAAGASLVGEDTIFDAVKEGRIEFERCICHKGSAEKLAKSGVARVLGPRGLMPNEKRNTIVENVRAAVQDMIGGTEYRERLGVVRVPIGQLRYTPEQLQANIKAFMTKLKEDIQELPNNFSKEVHEVVLSSTHSPGFPLSGLFQGSDSISPEKLHVI